MASTKDERKRVTAIAAALIGVVLLLLTGVIISLRQSFSNNKSGTAKTMITQDKTSGESFVQQEGVTQEQQTIGSNNPIFAGFSKLIDYGLTTDQVRALEQALQKYPAFANNNIQISLAVNDITRGARENSDPLYRFNILSHIVVNQTTTYRIKFYYSGTSEVQLILYDATGNIKLFDSGIVTATN